jgi:ParB family chromosome partitioning protein
VILTGPRAVTVLRLLIAGKGPDLAADLSGEPLRAVNALAFHVGYPNRDQMRQTLTRLEADLGPRTTTQPLHPDLVRHPPTMPTKPAPRASRAGQLIDVPLDQLHPDPDNPRAHLPDIPELAASMDTQGLLQPIVARRHTGRLIVVAGHRRLAAAQHLHWARIPTIINVDVRSDDVLALMITENTQRRDLDPIEEARALAALRDREHLSTAALAARLGRSWQTVAQRLDLLSLPAGDQERLRAGDMTLGAASRKARTRAGRGQPDGTAVRGWHFDHTHPLEPAAHARCIRLKHTPARRLRGGSGACGECWESVIRADEREDLRKEKAR